MNIVVLIKRVPDTETRIQIKNGQVVTEGISWIISPYDEYAVEEALQLSERYDGDSVAITMGTDDSVEALKRAIAMGMSEAVLLCDDGFQGSDAWGTAEILASAIKDQGEYTLVLTGKQSVDGNSGLVGPGVASKLGIPYVSNVVKIEEISGNSVIARRMLDEGMQTVKVPLPALLSVSIEINEPRYPNFMGIRKASKMKYPEVGLGDLPGLEAGKIGAAGALVKWTDLRKPPKRTGQCEFIQAPTPAEQAAALVDKLIADKVL